jgi:exodeoxyribonuclease VII small subunit
MPSQANNDTAVSNQLGAFEKDLGRLEEIVSLLERGGITLQESLELFEEGMTLGKRLQRILEHAELRIEELIENDDGNLETRLFETSS